MSGSVEPTHGGTRRARRRTGENRERLIRAGIIEFGTHGYHGVTTAAIGARADVPQPHIYANFRTKQDLFLACANTVLNLLKTPEVAHSSTGTEEAAFLLQLLAVARDRNLQTDIRALIIDIRSTIGEEALLAFVQSAISDVFNDNADRHG